MRLDKITIGSTKDSPTHCFKNLKNVTVDFDQKHWITVVIGWNGTGKSNVLEALASGGGLNDSMLRGIETRRGVADLALRADLPWRQCRRSRSAPQSQPHSH